MLLQIFLLKFALRKKRLLRRRNHEIYLFLPWFSTHQKSLYFVQLILIWAPIVFVPRTLWYFISTWPCIVQVRSMPLWLSVGFDGRIVHLADMYICIRSSLWGLKELDIKIGIFAIVVSIMAICDCSSSSVDLYVWACFPCATSYQWRVFPMTNQNAVPSSFIVILYWYHVAGSTPWCNTEPTSIGFNCRCLISTNIGEFGSKGQRKVKSDSVQTFPSHSLMVCGLTHGCTHNSLALSGIGLLSRYQLPLLLD